MTILKKLWDKVRPMTREEREHEWLSKSADLVELERRQRKLNHIDMGNVNANLKGWV
jgi:hypothetical protein